MYKKKVVIIGNSASPHVLNRLTRFAAEDDFFFLLFDTNFDSDSEIPIQRISRKIPEFLNLPRIRPIIILSWTLFRLKIAKPEIIFIMYCSKLSLLYSIFFRGKVILSFWGSDILSRPGVRKNLIINYIQKRAILKAARIYCVSKEQVEKVFEIVGDKLSINPILLMYGLDLKLYDSIGGNNPDKDEYCNIYSPRWCLPLYNIEIIIDAVILLLKQGKKVRLVYRDVDFNRSEDSQIYSTKLAEKIKKSGFNFNFRAVGLLGLTEQIRLLQSSDIVISVSHFDGTPLSILEAMACKKVVVCGKILSTTNIINHELNGYLVNKENSSEIADRIILILENADPQKRVQENARLFVEHNANIDVEVRQYINSFQEV